MSFFKVLVIGETNVGKTSLTNKMVYDTFNPQYKATIGCEFALKVVEHDEETLKIQLWDLAGQDKLGGVSRLYCRDASAAIVVADITSMESLRKAITWKSNVDEAVGLPDSKIPMVLCLNKCDLTDSIEVDLAEAEDLAKQNHIRAVFLTSAKEGNNLDEVVRTIARLIKDEENRSTNKVINHKGIKLKRGPKKTNKKKYC